MAEASEATDKTSNRTVETVITDNSAGYIYNKILETYPFLTDEERNNYVTRTSCLTEELNPLERIKAYLNLLDNPHAEIIELQTKDNRKYPSPISRPDARDKNHPIGEMIGDILYIEIPSWSDQLTQTLTILESLVEDNKGTATGYVMDLRSNRGGNEEFATIFAQHFLSSGEIVYGRQVTIVDGKQAMISIAFYSQNENPITAPIVLLVSDSTVSTSELFIALMKQRNNVVVIGSQTQGGSAGAEKLYVEIDGKKYTVPIPTWRFFLPGHDRPIEETKIQPDIYQDPTKPEIVDYAINHVRDMARQVTKVEPLGTT